MRFCARAWVWPLVALLAGSVWAAGAAAEDATATTAYEKVVSAYLNSRWEELAPAQRAAYRCLAKMTPSQRADLVYIRTTAAEFRPAWWKLCASTAPTKIRPKVWGRTILANYKPAEGGSVSGSFDGPRWEKVEVSWNPSLVDNPSPQGSGSAIRAHDVRRGDVGEVVVWQQLGRVFFMASLPVNAVRRLYSENRLLVDHLDWYYGNLTSYYHCSPKARRVTMLMHCATIQGTSSASEAQRRACHALGALFASLVLKDPSKWPSVTLPYSTPEEEIEKRVIAYLYANVSPNWTLAEDRALRAALEKFYRAHSLPALLKNRGRLSLPNGLPFLLMEPDDRPYQAKRDQWVKTRLEKASQ